MSQYISKYVSYKEVIHSQTAKRKRIDNTPHPEHLTNIILISQNLFDPLRVWVGGAVKINSFFRSLELNSAIGGSKKSQHMKGQAIDIDDTYGHKTNLEMFNYIKDNMDFDQLINEFPDEAGNPSWIHVSYKMKGNRKQVLKAVVEKGDTKYYPWF